MIEKTKIHQNSKNPVVRTPLAHTVWVMSLLFRFAHFGWLFPWITGANRLK